MTHPKTILLIFFSVAVVSSGLAFYTADQFSPASEFGTAQLGDVLPKCDPAKPPSAGGCGVSSFLQLLANIISILTRLTLIIAPLLIAAGGIVILSAGGSAERMNKGKSMITAAVVGIVIVLGAYLLIRLLFLALDVNTTLVPRSEPFTL